MKHLLHSLLALSAIIIPIVACSNETVTKPSSSETPAPTEETTPPEPEADPCACPNVCESTTMPGKKTCVPGEAAKTQKSGEIIKNFGISDFEYWPWKEPEPIYPDKVQWGYGAGSPAAKKCMTEARKVLVDILKNDVPPELEEFRKAHPDADTFYNWNNDMTDAPKSVKLPPLYEGLWLYEKKLIKWMSHTERDGTCRIPTREDLVVFAKGCLKTYPNCDSGKGIK